MRARIGKLLFFVVLPVTLLSLMVRCTADMNKVMAKVQVAAARSEEGRMAVAVKELIASTNLDSIQLRDNVTIHRLILNSNNFVKTAFVPERTNATGEALDRWGTPYQIKIDLPSDFLIRSAGPNGLLGDKDDVVYINARSHTH